MAKKLMKRRTAVILGIVFLILIFCAFFFYFINNYQKEYELPPELSLVLNDGNGTEVKMLLIGYDWTYKGENTNFLLTDDIETYPMPEENIAFTGKDYSIAIPHATKVKSNVRYKTLHHAETYYEVKNGVASQKGVGNGPGDISDMLAKGNMYLNNGSAVGEYLHTMTLDYAQGTALYAVVTVNFKYDNAKIAKEYMDTSLDNTEKIKELAKKIDFNEILKDVSVDNKNLKLKYDYYINETALKMNNLIFFACIPELETITYTAEHEKTYYFDSEKNESVIDEFDEIVYTRDEINSENRANVENLIKYMESI